MYTKDSQWSKEINESRYNKVVCTPKTVSDHGR